MNQQFQQNIYHVNVNVNLIKKKCNSNQKQTNDKS